MSDKLVIIGSSEVVQPDNNGVDILTKKYEIKIHIFNNIIYTITSERTKTDMRITLHNVYCV